MTEWKSLLGTEFEKRDLAWEKKFLASLPNAKVRLLAPDPQVGPDHWPYLMAAIDEDGSPGEDVESLTNILEWLSSRGIGLALNPQKTAPDFVLTYGMIWNFRERGEFLTEKALGKSGSFNIQHGQEVLTGAPSAAFLPPYVRSILKQFLGDQGVFAPKVLMASFDKENFELCFSIESLNSPPAGEHPGIAEALSWFLPAHYAVSLVSEKALPGFQPL
jgi:hypothetical protein